ncbi:MAG: hypothetical protein ACRDO4_17080 [Nocardioides sp.]
MSEHHPSGPAAADVTAERTRAFVAVALGLVGAMGGGAIGTGLQWLSFSLFDGDFFQEFIGLVALGFGAASLWLAAGVRSSDPVAVPARRAAQVLGVVAVVGGVLTVLGALTGDF